MENVTVLQKYQTNIDWKLREKKFKELIQEIKSKKQSTTVSYQ